MIAHPSIDTSRRDTTAAKVPYMAHAGMFARLGSRAWVHRALRMRVVESRPDRDTAAVIVKRRQIGRAHV